MVGKHFILKIHQNTTSYSYFVDVSVSYQRLSSEESGSIKFTYEVEQDDDLPFLDLLLVRIDTSRVKLQTYRKPTQNTASYSTHTDQHLHFNLHHPVEHKLSVVRTLLERSKSIVTDSEDKEKEDTHVEEILRTCRYPEWSSEK